MTASLAARMAERIEKTEGCWYWRGNVNPATGYGRLGIGQRNFAAHRLSYELHVGPIPEGLDLDHLCRVRHCVNPAHLEPVTRWENTRRGVGITAQRARSNVCKHGHEYTTENTIIQRGYRLCRTCKERRDTYWKEQRRNPKDPTRCKQGHEWTEANTYMTRAGHRSCRTCHRNSERARRAAA